MKVIVKVRMTTTVEVDVDDKYKALAKDDNDMTWQDVDDLFDQAAKEASKKFPDADFIEVKAVKSKQGDILLES